jgi:hypothetical protein
MGIRGGPKDIEFRALSDGPVTVPQFDPSQCKITPADPTIQPSVDVTWQTELKVKSVVGDVGTRLIGSFVHVPPE